MAEYTNIEWTDTTSNPTSGCDGCEIFGSCYARTLHEGRLALALPQLYARDFTELRLIPGRMAKAASLADLTGRDRPEKPWFNGRPRHIFISDMSDALSEAVPFEYLLSEIIQNVTSKQGRRHVWQWLTKRPERMAEFDAWLAAQGIEWPQNLWAGTSVTQQQFAEKRVNALQRVRASVRYLSVEPMLGPVQLSHLWRKTNGCSEASPDFEAGIGIHWVICGGESGPHARPMDPNWVRMLRDQCVEARVPFFFKQWGGIHKAAAGRILDGVTWNELPVTGAVGSIPVTVGR